MFIVCFSVISPMSLENVKDKWIPELKQHCADVPIVLVGTKVDLRDDAGIISDLKKKELKPLAKDDGEKCKKEIGAMKYCECSARTMNGLNEVFDHVIEVHYENVMSDETGRKKKKCLLQ